MALAACAAPRLTAPRATRRRNESPGAVLRRARAAPAPRRARASGADAGADAGAPRPRPGGGARRAPRRTSPGDYLVGRGPVANWEDGAEARTPAGVLAMCFSNFCFMLRLPEPLKRFTLPAQIVLWFSCYMIYNLMTKQLLNVLPAPFALHSAFNLVCVALSMLTLAAVEAARPCQLPDDKGTEGKGGLPDLRLRELLSVDAGRGWRQGVLHATTHAASMAAIGGASLCYAHTAKATEPLFSAIIAALFFGKQLALRVWLSLVPIIGGVAYASFTPGAGMDAAVAYALSAAIICSSTLAFHQASIKASMKEGEGSTPVAGSPLRVYARALLRAAPVAFGLAVVMEGAMLSQQAGAMLAQAAAAMGGYGALGTTVFMAGVSFFLYNQLALICLESLSPLSSSIGNVLKRVFVVAVSVTLMGGAVTERQLVGFGIAMLGVGCYSLASMGPAPAKVEAAVASA